MPKITPGQKRTIVDFVNYHLREILTPVGDFGNLKPLLSLGGVEQPPKDFDVARNKIDELKFHAELPGNKFKTTGRSVNYEVIQIQLAPPSPDGLYFEAEAQRTPSGFGAIVRAYLRPDVRLINGAARAVSLTGGLKTRELVRELISYPIVRELDVPDVIDVMKTYSIAVSPLIKK